MTATDQRARFHQLHQSDELFVMPNPWDVGSARLLASLGFPALATTSSGHAFSLGRVDGQVTRDELVEHVGSMVTAVEVPFNVDSERCFSEDLDGIAQTIDHLAAQGAAGCSIEDWDPQSCAIDPVDVATDRVRAAVEAANSAGIVLTARAANHLRGVQDLDDTIARLCRYRDVGAHCLYAPGLAEPADIGRLVQEVGAPVNVLAVPNGPSINTLADLGVRRVSVGGSLARAAYSALLDGATELLDRGTSVYLHTARGGQELAECMVGRPDQGA